MAKKTNPKDREKSATNRQGLFIGLASFVVGCIALGAIVTYFLIPTNIEKALTLQERLLAIDENTTRQVRNALFVELARTIDRMNRDELQDFRHQIREEQQKKLDDAVSDYLLAPESDRVQIVDRELERFDRMQDVFSAMQGGSRGRRRGPDARRSDDDRPDGTPSEARRSEDEEKQVALQRSTFFEAMKKRAKEKGQEFNPRRMRG